MAVVQQLPNNKVQFALNVGFGELQIGKTIVDRADLIHSQAQSSSWSTQWSHFGQISVEYVHFLFNLSTLIPKT